jgi:hypothetical protein
MNYARYADWIRERVEDLVSFGIPRDEAESLMFHVERGGISAEAEARREDQFLLDFKRLGSTVMAVRHGCSPQAVRKQRTKLLNRNPELRRELREA